MAINWFGKLFSGNLQPTRLDDGSYYYRIMNGLASWNKGTTYNQKIQAILQNPAALYIFILLPELFSMGKYKLYRGEEEVESDPLLDLLRNPNPMQTAAQFKWDYMFYRKLGTANLYIDSRQPGEKNKLYFLSPDCIVWPEQITKKKQSLFLSDESVNQLKETQLKYKTQNQEIPFTYEQLLQFFDLSNGMGNWFESPSRVDALYKIIANSDFALKAKNVNANFAGKFIVPGKVDMANTSAIPMSESDKTSVRDSMFSNDSVYPTKTMVDIKRFVENGSILKSLDEAYMTDAFLIGKMLNIPKDVIEMLGDSTYENQEKARAAIISYCIDPDAQDFCDGIIKYFGYGPDYTLKIDFSHLPFVQVFENEKADVLQKKAMAYMRMVSGGIRPEDAAMICGWELDQFNDPVRLVGEPSREEGSQQNLRAI